VNCLACGKESPSFIWRGMVGCNLAHVLLADLYGMRAGDPRWAAVPEQWKRAAL
jgi:hypothetical protein